MRRNSAAYVLLAVVITVASCGSDRDSIDHQGLTTGEDESAIFTRACQQYFRGSLSNSKENFNSLIYRFPDSPLKHDAQLAVRRIDFELSGNVNLLVQPDVTVSGDFPVVAVVGIPAVARCVSQLETVLLAIGAIPVIIEDSGAPDVTLVLYPEGYIEQASTVSDSLSTWLISHTSVPMQPGGDIITAVAPDHSGVVIVIGTDAAVDSSILRNLTQEP